MSNSLTKKYGLFTAITMVVGIVMGSGVFFKAQNVLNITNGNVFLGVIAWAIGGLVMISCAFCFAIMATKYEKVNGLVDYAEATCGKSYSYYIGWFISTIYYPAMTSVLAWVSARYTLVVFGHTDQASSTCLALAGLYLCLSYVINALAPILAGKFQVSTTIIKLIPLSLMAVVGIIYGLFVTPEGREVPNLLANFSGDIGNDANTLFAAVVATIFAYEGWIIATSINAEIKNAKKNLPIALVLGTLIIMVVYIVYYIGVAGGATVSDLQKYGATIAFTNIFGNVFGTVLNVFVAVSCIGTLNGLMLGCTRGVYALATRNMGPKPKIFSTVDPITNMPSNSAIFGLFVSALWLFYFYSANLGGLMISEYDAETANALVRLLGTFDAEKGKIIVNWFGFDSSEIPIVTVYALYLPIFIKMLTFKELSVFKRFIMPSVAILSSLFTVVAAVYAHKWGTLYYLIIFAIIMLIGKAFKEEKIKF